MAAHLYEQANRHGDCLIKQRKGKHSEWGCSGMPLRGYGGVPHLYLFFLPAHSCGV